MEPTPLLSVHHIGGRDGSRAFPLVDHFEPDIVNVLYEPDADCLAQIEERNTVLASRLHVLPYCFADARKPVCLNLNYDPYTSSLLATNPSYRSYYFYCLDHDYLWSEATETRQKIPLEAVSIDDIYQADAPPLPPPNFLSLDTQGSEYEILRGAVGTLRAHVVAVALEVEFHPLYAGQKLFGDLHAQLGAQGFDFVKFLNILSMSPCRAPIGLRSEGFQTSADALFLRRIDSIEEAVPNALQRRLLLQKLAFTAIVFNQFEYGWKCLQRSRAHAPTAPAATRYQRFLEELALEIDCMPQQFPETFATKYTFAASRSRFVPRGSTNTLPAVTAPGEPSIFSLESVTHLLRQTPVVYPFLRGLKHFVHAVRAKPPAPVVESYSAVELLLQRHGLEAQARLLHDHRIAQTSRRNSA